MAEGFDVDFLKNGVSWVEFDINCIGGGEVGEMIGARCAVVASENGFELVVGFVVPSVVDVGDSGNAL